MVKVSVLKEFKTISVEKGKLLHIPVSILLRMAFSLFHFFFLKKIIDVEFCVMKYILVTYLNSLS